MKEASTKKWPTLWSRNPNYSRVFFRHVLHGWLDASFSCATNFHPILLQFWGIPFDKLITGRK